MDNSIFPIVIVSHNRLNLTIECLDSLFVNTEIPFHAVLVDNGSDEDIQAKLCEYMTFRNHESEHLLSLVLFNYNCGIAQARNFGILGLRATNPSPLIGIFDNDIRFKPGWLPTALSVMEAKPRLGIFGCCFGSHPPKIPFTLNGRNYVTKANQPGHSWIVRTSLFDEVGMFDPNYGFRADGTRYGFCDGQFVSRVRASTDYVIACPTPEFDLVEHMGQSDITHKPKP